VLEKIFEKLATLPKLLLNLSEKSLFAHPR